MTGAPAARAAEPTAPDAPTGAATDWRAAAHLSAEPAAVADKLAAARAVSRPGGPSEPTPLELCLEQMLDALNWSGETRRLVEALPHVDPIDTVEVFKAALGRLGYEARVSRKRLAALSASDFPLVIFTQAGPVVATGRDLSGALRLAGREEQAEQMPAEAHICRISRQIARPDDDSSWVSRATNRVRGSLWEAVGLSFVINLFAMATPLYSMAVFNYAIGATAADTLAFLTAMVLLALVVDDYLRRLRGQLVADISARLNASLLCEGLAKILSLPLHKIEFVSVTGQISQIKRFENIQAFFKGPAVTTLLDLPFILIFAFAIGMLGGALVIAPLVVAVLFFVLLVVFSPIARTAERRAGAARRSAMELTRETVLAKSAIREASAEGLWLDRIAESLNIEARALARQNMVEQLGAQGAQLLLAIAGVAVLGGGAVLVMQEQLSIGALIAVSILTWRLLTPVQTFFTCYSQIRGVRDDLQMFEKLMRLETEGLTSQAAKVERRFEGAIKLDGVAYRPPHSQSFAVRNVSLEIEAGERFALVGPPGAGKTSLLRLALGLTPPTIGQVSLDGLPLNHLDNRDVRNAFAFVAERPQFVYGTIAQNLRFANPNASDDELTAVLEALELPLEPALFPDGLQTRLNASKRGELPPSALLKLNFARALVSDKPILATDAPTEALEAAERAALMGQLERLRGQRTVLIASADRAMVESCDRALLLESGQPVGVGPAAAVAAKAGALLR